MSSVTSDLDDFIAVEGKGNVRDALNVALARINALQERIDDLQNRLDRYDDDYEWDW